MKRAWLCLVAVVGVGACVGLVAREDKTDLPDDLARVPVTVKGIFTVRVADLWAGDLAKEFRKGFGKDLEQGVKHMRETFGLAPEDIERFTVASTDLMQPQSAAVLIVRTSKAFEAKKYLPRILPEFTEETLAGQKVFSGRGFTAFIGDGGKTLVFGARPAVEAVLEAKPGKATGSLAAMLARATKHSAAGYIDPSALASMVKDLPPQLAAAKSLLATKDGVAWLDVGYTSKLGMTLTFADEKAAKQGRKALDAGRTLASLTLSALDASVFKSKPITAFMRKAEAALDDGTVEQKDSAVDVAFELALEKATVAELVKEVMTKVVIASARAQAANNLKQIGIAMHNYHDTNGVFPPSAVYDKDGKAVLSWRVLILPYVEQDALYKEFRLDEPWDSPHNKKLIAKIPAVYVAPNGRASAVGGTFYQGFYGKSAAFDGKRGLKITDFTDGTSNTILVAEAAKDVPWTKPDDLPFDPDGKLPKLGGGFEGVFLSLFCDGSVRYLPTTIKTIKLKALITRDGGEVVPNDD